VAAAGVIVALLVGARERTSLVILFFAVFAADMNLRAVVRKARAGKLGGAGGYVAHVGLGIMLGGIVVSGVYARSTRLTLPANQPVMVEGSKLTFVRVIPGTFTRKQAMEVSGDGEGKTYYIPEDVRQHQDEPAHGQPGHQEPALFDFYVAPQP
jgi:cytochrome c biogenesis factor